MDSAAEITKPSPKPLGLLGRDEMNLAEFPITLLTDRVPKDQDIAIYQDEIHDERTGLTLTRKLTITAGSYGLTTAADDPSSCLKSLPRAFQAFPVLTYFRHDRNSPVQ